MTWDEWRRLKQRLEREGKWWGKHRGGVRRLEEEQVPMDLGEIEPGLLIDWPWPIKRHD